MTKLKIIVLTFICFFSCKEKENKDIKTITNSERVIKRALISGYFAEINENIGVSFYQDNIFYFSSIPDGFTEGSFMLHLIKEDNSFDNHSFSKDKYLLNDSLKGGFSSLEIIQRKIYYESYKSIRIGQFIKNEDKSTKNIWIKQIAVKDILDSKQQYLNQFNSILKRNLLNEDFKNDLKFGKFFKTKTDFYVLLSDPNIFFIAKKNNVINEKFMLHFIREDNTFNNKSFTFKTKEYQQYLEPPFSNFSIAKISIPNEEDYSRIRIGQYNSKGNIWVQEFKLQEVLANELLKYNQELEK